MKNYQDSLCESYDDIVFYKKIGLKAMTRFFNCIIAVAVFILWHTTS
ncbi:hypothetical protein CCP3SC1AL1_2490002 [Gammaproteobacteria bacterium]